MKRRPPKSRLRVYAPVGEWRLGPGKVIEFTADPIPLPNRSCAVRWGGDLLIVRVDSVDIEGRVFGEVVGKMKELSEPKPECYVSAQYLIERGLVAIARENDGT